MGWRRVLPGRDGVPTGCERALQLLFLLSDGFRMMDKGLLRTLRVPGCEQEQGQSPHWGGGSGECGGCGTACSPWPPGNTALPGCFWVSHEAPAAAFLVPGLANCY